MILGQSPSYEEHATCAAKETVTAPAKLQFRMQGPVSRGTPPRTAVADPGDQGPAGVGVQGMGASVPISAAVAPATAGFAILEQTPKGRIFKKGTIFMMVPI